MTVLTADWDAPPGVRAFVTTRSGGVSQGGFASLNLGDHVGDDPDHVRQNRALLRQGQGWTNEPFWLKQVHGTTVARWEDGADRPEADGAVTSTPGQPLVVLTADCLPIVLAGRHGTVVGVVHAGWRGLVAGVVEAGLRALGVPGSQVVAWVGPGIGPASYQVGPDVYKAFASAGQAACFEPDGAQHWRFDLGAAAEERLRRAGAAVWRSRWDTARDDDVFFSHRRSAPCGRVGTFVVMTEGGQR